MYSNMKSGVTMKDLCIRFNPLQLNIDERSLVEFGILEGFIRRIHEVILILILLKNIENLKI